jgi:hypothetical protein
MLARKVRATNAIVIIAPMLFLLWGADWFYDNVISQVLVLLNTEQSMAVVATSLPAGLFFILVFAMLGFGDILHQLYVTRDLEMLLVAPVPFPTIFLVKLIQCSRAPFIPALGIGAFLAALGLAWNAPASFYLLIALSVLLFIIMATALVMILVIHLARWLPVQRVRSWMPVFVVLLTLALMLGQRSATQWFLGQVGLITFLSEALLNTKKMSLACVVLTGVTAVVFLSAMRIFVLSFHEGWNRFGNVPSARRTASQVIRHPRGTTTRLKAWVPAPLRVILAKEWLELKRNPRGLLALVQPLVLVGASLMVFGGTSKGMPTLRPFVFYAMLAFLALFLSTQAVGTSLMAMAQEGRNILILRGAPISMSAVLKGKFWATWLPVAASWTIVFLVAGTWLQFPIWQTAFLVLIALWGLVGTSMATMAIGGLKVDFTSEDLRKRTSAATNYLTMGLNGFFASLTILTCVWLIIHFYPDSRPVLAIRGLSGYSAFRPFFSDDMALPLGLLACQIAFWAGIKMLWDSAARRLESWEAV